MSGTTGGFEVDVSGVRNFGAKLQEQVDKDLAPGADVIKTTFLGGTCFGRTTDSAVVQQAVTVYYQQLKRSVELIDTFLHNSAVMAQAASEVVAAYENADTMSGQDLQVVLDQALRKVDALAAAAQKTNT